MRLGGGGLHKPGPRPVPTRKGPREERAGFDPWVRKMPWRRRGDPLQYSCLEHPMDRGAWRLWSTGS